MTGWILGKAFSLYFHVVARPVNYMIERASFFDIEEAQDDD